MEINLEELNTIYRKQLAEFLSVIDIEKVNEIKNRIISDISNYFNRAFKNLLFYDLSEIEEKIIEVFHYGIERSQETKEHVSCYTYDTLENFERKNNGNQEARQQVIQNFDASNPSNNFADLTYRIVTLIDSSLAKKNWNNKNYEKYHYQIKMNLKKYIDNEKNKMLEDIKESLSQKDRKIEKEILSSYKDIVSKLEKNTNLDVMETSLSFLETSSNQDVFSPITQEDNSQELLPGDVIK